MGELGATPWVDSAWTTFAPRLQAVGYDMRRLPDMDSTSPMNVKEHGAGTWGVVSPTNHPGVVVKLTTDYGEALLVSLLLGQPGYPGIGQPPRGIVRYDDVLQLKHEKHNGREIYVVWRSEATDIGGALVGATHANGVITNPGNSLAMNALMPITRVTSIIRHIWMDMVTLRKGAPDDARYVAMLDVLYDHVKARSVSNLGPLLARITLAFQQLWYEIGRAQKVASCKPIADAFEFFLQRGILLSDVHWNNIGRDIRSPFHWIITDPGHAIVLDTSIRFPPIEGV